MHAIYIQASSAVIQSLGCVPGAQLFVQEKVFLQKQELILERLELKLNKNLSNICSSMVKSSNFDFLESMYQMDKNFVFPTKKVQIMLMKIGKHEEFKLESKQWS